MHIKMKPDIVIVGAGISGITFARKYAEDNPKKKILIIEKRDHIGAIFLLL